MIPIGTWLSVGRIGRQSRGQLAAVAGDDEGRDIDIIPGRQAPGRALRHGYDMLIKVTPRSAPIQR